MCLSTSHFLTVFACGASVPLFSLFFLPLNTRLRAKCSGIVFRMSRKTLNSVLCVGLITYSNFSAYLKDWVY